MAVIANASMRFIRYEVIDDARIECTFQCDAPGAGEKNLYVIHLTFAEISANSAVQLRDNFVIPRLQRQIRATGISTKLDGLINQSVVIP